MTISLKSKKKFEKAKKGCYHACIKEERDQIKSFCFVLSTVKHNHNEGMLDFSKELSYLFNTKYLFHK